MDKRGLITQSNYIPWKGYFDAINSVDECILLDDVQYTRRDWRNRNRIKTPQGLRWLTIPVMVKDHYTQLISETRVADAAWGEKHWRTLQHSYGRAPFYRAHAARLEEVYLGRHSELLSDINLALLQVICRELGIETPLRRSSEFELVPGRNQRIISICQQAGITNYYTGMTARAYLDEARFEDGGIRVHWIDHRGYGKYPQIHGAFEHRVTILDLLFNTGPDARSFMKTFPESSCRSADEADHS